MIAGPRKQPSHTKNDEVNEIMHQTGNGAMAGMR